MSHCVRWMLRSGRDWDQVLTVIDIISVHRQFHIEIFGFILMQVIGK